MDYIKFLSSCFSKKFTLESFAVMAGLIGQLAVYAQAFKIFSLHSSYAVSLTGILISLSSMVVWFVYGIKKNVKPLVISNLFGIIGALLVLGGIFYYW